MLRVNVPASLWASAATASTPALRLLLRRRVSRGKEIAERLSERWGIEAAPRPEGRLLWMHAASVGESVSILPVLSEIARRRSDVSMLVTTGTVTSAEVLERRLPELDLQNRVLHRFAPLDVPRWTKRFLDHWRPNAGAFMESELWPNFLAACKSRRIPIMLLNARMSERSYAKWRVVHGFARMILRSFETIQAQSEIDAVRLRELGAPVVTTPGNLKFAAPPLPADPVELARVREWLGKRDCWLAASTHPGEEEIILETHRRLSGNGRTLVTIIVPRHPERGGNIGLHTGIEVTRRSLGERPPTSGIWVADTLGELGLWYRVARLALIGRSLIPPGGGQNPLEAARLGCAVAVGPYTGNFMEPVQVLSEAGALTRVTDAITLAEWVAALLNARDDLAEIGTAAATAVERYVELPGRIATELISLLLSP